MKRIISMIILLTLYCLVKIVFAQGEINAGKTKSVTCAACHGQDGNITGGSFPKLAGQYAGYLYKQLLDFKAGDKGLRNNPIMFGMVQGLTEQDMADISAYYASQQMTSGVAKASLIALGQRLYRGGDREKMLPACMACHGPKGEGNELANFPLLRGQNEEYIMTQLKAFRDDTRRNDLNHMMRDIALKMTDKEIIAVASYISGLH